MRARDLVSAFPTVLLDVPVLEATRLLVDHALPGLIVVDRDDRPVSVLPGTQVLRLAVPRYCQDDPALARVIDEAHADVFLQLLADRTVRDALPQDERPLPVADEDATMLELAAIMAQTRSPLVAVVREERLVGAITLHDLMARLVNA